MIITKEDFNALNLVKFSQNIREDQIDPYIMASQEYDLEPRLAEALYSDILAVLKGEIVRPELLAFANSKVKRYLVLASYYRFLSAHGINITQFGVSQTRDPQGTFDQVTPKDRAVVLRQVASDLNVALIKMTKEPFIFDGVSYEKTAKGSNQNQMIRAPKRKRNIVNGVNLYSEIIKN
jgi:membrane peptidoglycan carboxypeptidase